MQRPYGVTIVGSLIILIAAFGLLGVIFVTVHRPSINWQMAAFMARDPVPAITRHAVEFLIGTVEFIAGILILRGWDMGRTLYTVIGAIGLAFAFATSPFREALVVNLVIFAIFLFVLYQPVSAQWFRRADAWHLPG